MAIKDWPQGEQPREKLLAQGASSLSNAELLALFIRTGIPGKSALDVGREALQKFKGLRNFLNSSLEEFSKIAGLGSTKYILLQGALEIGRRYLAENLERLDTLNNPNATRKYLTARLRDLPYEVFACLFLDNKNRVIAYEELFQGSLHGADIYPREVVKRALHYNAAAVIFAHNHPSGVADASAADKAVTRKLQQALSLVETRVLDHLIIGDGYITSLAELGELMI